MKHVILLFVASFTTMGGFAQDAKNPEAAAFIINEMVEGTKQQGLRLRQYQFQLEALREAIKTLKAAKGSDRHLAALEELVQAQEKEFNTAQKSYLNTLRNVRDLMLTVPYPHGSEPKE